MNETDPVILRFIVIMAGIGVTLASLWFGFRKVNSTAREAVDNTGPVSNGFAANTRVELAEIKALVLQSDQRSAGRFERLEGKIDDHLQDHASAHVRRSE